MKMHIDNETLKKKIMDDPDYEVEAGVMHPEAINEDTFETLAREYIDTLDAFDEFDPREGNLQDKAKLDELSELEKKARTALETHVLKTHKKK